MRQMTWLRVTLAVVVAVGIIALLAWARNDPGVDDRDPDPPQSTEVVTVAPQNTPAVTSTETAPPTT